MHIHILGICGTFMGSLAILARELRFDVSGSDANVYPPMSTQLQEQGIALREGFEPSHLQPHPDLVVIGNAMSRGNPAVEYVLDQGLPYCSGPEFLARHVLPGKWVLAVAGTHGKTTTSAMLAWILEYAGLRPGYLIGGVLKNFPVSARAGDSDFFVVEADEYDSAFFDKRSKFVHYRPRTLILNNLEYDHADIFPDLAAIQTQFHHLVRTVPAQGLLLSPTHEPALDEVLARGCWTPVQRFGIAENSAENITDAQLHWDATLLAADGSRFQVNRHGTDGSLLQVPVHWSLTGRHNVSNALAAVAAAHHAGVDVPTACEALNRFASVKRRMEWLGEAGGVHVYDDFAHHPTAIATTLDGMRQRLAETPEGRLVAVIEPRSATMKMGTHQHALAGSTHHADLCLWMAPADGQLDIDALIAGSPVPAQAFSRVDDIVHWLAEHVRPGDHIVVMSNGGFGGIHGKLLQALAARAPEAVMVEG